MACLRTARAHGHLELSNIMNNGLVSTEYIKQGLVHQHNQVRGQRFFCFAKLEVLKSKMLCQRCFEAKVSSQVPVTLL